MADTTYTTQFTSETTIVAQTSSIANPAVEAPTNTNAVDVDETLLDDELGEELIIEDFTIDGICGVY